MTLNGQVFQELDQPDDLKTDLSSALKVLNSSDLMFCQGLDEDKHEIVVSKIRKTDIPDILIEKSGTNVTYR